MTQKEIAELRRRFRPDSIPLYSSDEWNPSQDSLRH